MERREVWYSITGFLVPAADADAFMSWARSVDFWGRWMPAPAKVYSLFFGEYPWAPAARHFLQPYFGDRGWVQPDKGCPTKVRTAAFEYLAEANGFDCSIDSGFTLRMPAREIIDGLQLRWSGRRAEYVDRRGRVVAYDPTIDSPGPSALLMRVDVLEAFLREKGYALGWCVLGEKRVLSAAFRGRVHPELQLSGAYVLKGTSVDGFMNKRVVDYSAT